MTAHTPAWTKPWIFIKRSFSDNNSSNPFLSKATSKFDPSADLDRGSKRGNPNLRGLERDLNMLRHRLWLYEYLTFYSIKLIKFHLNCRWKPNFFMLIIFAVLLCYLNCSERKDGKTLAWTGLEPWPVRCLCSSPPIERQIVCGKVQ